MNENPNSWGRGETFVMVVAILIAILVIAALNAPPNVP